ncbi:MAG TPA: rhomboid family intramembrane serine protease [Nannocystaceae bacterium]|nr:rhomboid family intramembrane serine protease [Nannocystaceae bacterium]
MPEREQRFLEVVQGLCDEAIGGKLLALGRVDAVVAMPDGTAAAVLSADCGPPEEIEEHFRRVVTGNPSTDLKLVVIGGDARHRELLGRVQPRLMMRRVVQVFVLGDDGEPWAGAGSRIDSPMGRVLTEVATREAPREVDREALRATIVAPSPEAIAELQERRGFVDKLAQGRSHATMAIVFTYAIAFALEQLWGGGDFIPTLANMGAGMRDALGSEPWRLLSPAWLHLGWLHLIVNGYVMIVLGGFLERLLGWRRMLLVYVAAALGGGLASAAFSTAAISVGASGAIWGLLGASIALAWRPGSAIPPAVLPVLRRNAIVNLVVNLAVSFMPQVDLFAHLGGGVVGLALGFAGLPTRGLGSPDAERKLQPFVFGAVALHVAAFATAIVIGKPWATFAVEQTRTIALPGATLTVPVQLGEPMVGGTSERPRFVVGDLARHPLMIDFEVTTPDIAAEPIQRDPGLVTVGKVKQLEGVAFPTTEQHFVAEEVGIRMVLWQQQRDGAVIDFEGYYWAAHPEVEPAARAAFDSLTVP